MATHYRRYYKSIQSSLLGLCLPWTCRPNSTVFVAQSLALCLLDIDWSRGIYNETTFFSPFSFLLSSSFRVNLSELCAYTKSASNVEPVRQLAYNNPKVPKPVGEILLRGILPSRYIASPNIMSPNKISLGHRFERCKLREDYRGRLPVHISRFLGYRLPGVEAPTTLCRFPHSPGFGRFLSSTKSGPRRFWQGPPY